MTADTQGPTPFAVVSKDGIGCTQVGFRCADGESASYFPCVTAHMTAADLNAAVAARERAAAAKALIDEADLSFLAAFNTAWAELVRKRLRARADALDALAKLSSRDDAAER